MLLDLMEMTILPQKANNLIAQFVRIVFKIFGNYLLNKAKFFLDNIGIKVPKTIVIGSTQYSTTSLNRRKDSQHDRKNGHVTQKIGTVL